MRFFAFLFVAAFGSANAFTTTTDLAMSSGTHMDKQYTVGSGMTEHEIPLFIQKMTIDNFEETLEMLEPLLTNECVGDICDDYVGELEDKAQEIGKSIPPGYAATHH